MTQSAISPRFVPKPLEDRRKRTTSARTYPALTSEFDRRPRMAPETPHQDPREFSRFRRIARVSARRRCQRAMSRSQQTTASAMALVRGRTVTDAPLIAVIHLELFIDNGDIRITIAIRGG
ncbi:hypothetical protein [Mycobacterium sp. GA-2829]|uniref:hypothetical protein n=1 Tax=Mycobacterium sp. GA-2829 TaxID=1772283 RepID=UPI0012F85905|nr:hypothetical protein [Mycobacterium sp. GA-2829]